MRMPLVAARQIFNKGLDAVAPSAMIQSYIKRKGNTIFVENKMYELNENVNVVGFGKAVAGMCRAVQDMLSDHITRGILSVPSGLAESLKQANKSSMLPVDDGKISVYEGAKDNLPDASSSEATLKIIDLLKSSKDDDLVISLISGGGSALLCAPVPPVTLEEKLEVTKMLSKSGASIQELNTIRKSLSLVKGGGLARIAFPAKVITLILSDIVGDPLDLIASGPTVKSTSTLDDCAKIMKKYGLIDKIPQSARPFLGLGQNLEKSNDGEEPFDFSHVQNVLVGTNAIAVHAAKEEARKLDYHTFILSKKVEGEAKDVGMLMIELGIVVGSILSDISREGLNEFRQWWMNQDDFANFYFTSRLQNPVFGQLPWIHDFEALIREIYEFILDCDDLKKVCIISAGETTVNVRGKGLGGRNQEMVLAAALHYHKCTSGNTGIESEVTFKLLTSKPPNLKLTFLSAGTDGQDGPTDAAGVLFDNGQNKFIKTKQDYLEAEEALLNNDSYNFLKKHSSNLLITGLTGTNVMDIQVLTLEMRS